MTWNDIKWRPLTFFLTALSGVAVFLQWLIVRSWSLASVWGYVGTASVVFFLGLVLIERRLWRLRIIKWRPFSWITKVPDISGDWKVEMTPAWKGGGVFLSRATVRQTLFSIQLDIYRPSSYSESRAASIFSTGDHRWNFACVYQNRPEAKPEEHGADHEGCLLVTIDSDVDPSHRMSGRYWTNKRATLLLSQLPNLQGLRQVSNQIDKADLSRASIQVYATSGHVVFTR